MLVKTSDDYSPCVVVYPHGHIRKANVLNGHFDTAEEALAKLRNDRAAWVTYADYESIKDKIPHGKHDSTTA